MVDILAQHSNILEAVACWTDVRDAAYTGAAFFARLTQTQRIYKLTIN